MTQAEKYAKELVERFYIWTSRGKYREKNYYDAQQCALICIDERLKEIDEYFESTKGQVEILALWNHYVAKQRYWQERKQAINKL